MSLIPTVYRSTDPGAPVLSGTAGSFAALMDAVLVNGYGTGPDAKPGLGWVRAFSDGHKRAYQNSLADGGTGMFWRIDDSNAQYVLNSAFHTMSGIDAGVDEFGGGANAWGKSVTANTTSRPWVVIGNSRSCYVFIQNGSSTGAYSYVGYFVGDYSCISSSYSFNFAISRSNYATVSSGAGRSSLLTAGTLSGAMLIGARSYDSLQVGAEYQTRAATFYYANYIGGQSGSGAAPYPYLPTGGALVSRVLLTNGGYIFGSPPGLWAPEHYMAFTSFNEYTGVVGMPSDRCIAVGSYGANPCQGIIELSREWSY